MIQPQKKIGLYAPRYRFFLHRLEELLARMDDAYDTAAGGYGFLCTGCIDNCCLTKFHHHTLLEYLLLMEGFCRLDTAIRSDLKDRSQAVLRQYEKGDAQGLSVHAMCPLNNEGICCLYRYRPMICRLHGIPHELRKPGGSVARGPGCTEFDNRCGQQNYVPFDRTPYYVEMAELERELKMALAVTGKFKMTVAEMVLRFDSEGCPSPPDGNGGSKAYEIR